MTVERHAIPPGMRLHPLRAQDLTASDVGAAIGMDPYKSPLALYAEKTGMILPQGDNAATTRGRWFEPAVVAASRETFPGWDFRYPLGLYLRDPETRLGATPDAAAEDPENPGLINVQLKTVTRFVFERDWSDDRAPLNYTLQTLAEGFLMDASRSILAALVFDAYTCELVVRDVPRHAAAEARICAIAQNFWQNIAAGRRPAPDYSRDAETIAAMFPKQEPGKVLDLGDDNRLPWLLSARVDFKAALDKAATNIEAIDTEIKAKLGEAEAAELPGWRLTWKAEERKAYTVAASSRRVLRVKQLDPSAGSGQAEKAA